MVRMTGRISIVNFRKGKVLMFQKVSLALVALAILATAPAEAASTASINRQFRDAIARVLNSVRNEQPFLQELTAAEFKEFVACAQGIMNAAPLERKQYVLAASNMSEMRSRFDEVALDNRAALKQKITRDCS
jgi:hypothetical protein